jgi:hypothetical protein
MPNLQARHFTPVTPASVTGTTVYPVELVGVLIQLANDAAAVNVDIVLNSAVRFLKATIVKMGANGGAGDTVTIQNGAAAITDARVLNINLYVVVPANPGTTSWSVANSIFAAGDTLRIARAFNTNNACQIALFGVAYQAATPGLAKNLKNRHMVSQVPTASAIGAPLGLGALLFLIADAASASYDFTLGQAFEVFDLALVQTGAGNAGNSVTVHNETTGVDITDGVVINAGAGLELFNTDMGVQSLTATRFAAGDVLRLTVVRAGNTAGFTLLLIGIPR